jgi:Flp pilus assembly protein TadD
VLAVGGCGKKAATVEELITAARHERSQNNPRAAIVHLKNLLQKAPEHAEARYLLGVSYKDASDFVSAEVELRRALSLKYDPAKVIPPLGRSLLLAGEFRKVLDQIQLEGEVSDPVQAEVLTLRALALIGLRRNQEARELLEQALVKQPEFSDALLGKARLAAGENNLDETARLIERAISSAPDSAEAWFMKGELNRFTAHPDEADAAYQKALSLDPYSIRARLGIASLTSTAERLMRRASRSSACASLLPTI